MHDTSSEQGRLPRFPGRSGGKYSKSYTVLWSALLLGGVINLALAGDANAQVQWNPFKPGFGKQVAPEPQMERLPVAPPPSGLTAPRRQPAAADPGSERAAPRVSAPLPPPRPENLQAGSRQAPATPAATERTGSRPSAVEAAKAATRTGAHPAPATSAEALARVNQWLNSYDAIRARFIQHNAQGQKAEGTLYVKRPGQLVFKYDAPSTLEIVADGKSVAVRDSKLRTNDVYSIGQTPLKFLLKDPVNLATDIKLINISTDADGIIRISATDSSTLGGSSKITLIFDSKANQLKQWNIVDPQGYRTTVALYDLRLNER